ncbi:PRC-barrel domain-containing protein [Bartonella sp. DGB2]|uniref:PRC-barrel domain-containing protein n=1 Tax=Bartonella sp. DGB2 TaxID=3388426 RepID=UPI0039901A5C
MKRLAFTTFTIALLAGSAYAQTVATTDDTVPVTIQNKVATSMNTREANYVSPSDTDFVASSLIGTNVQNLQDETIGEVKDIVLRQNNLEGIVIGVGGFLGIGERYVVVSPDTIQMSHADGKWKLVANATKDSLKAAPEFKYVGRWIR